MTTQLKYADINELNYGVTLYELELTEKLAKYVKENRHKESMFKTTSEFASILGIDPASEENILAINYAVNVCKRLFPHHVKHL